MICTPFHIDLIFLECLLNHNTRIFKTNLHGSPFLVVSFYMHMIGQRQKLVLFNTCFQFAKENQGNLKRNV